MPAVLICCRRADHAEGERLQRLVRARVPHAGILTVADDEMVFEPGDGSRIKEDAGRLHDLVATCGLCLVVVTPRWHEPEVRRRLFDAHDAIRRTLVAVQAHAFRSTAHPCSCFGAMAVERSHHVGFLRAMALLTASVLMVVQTATSEDPLASQLPTGAESLAGVALAVTILLTSTLLDQTLWFNNVRPRGASSR